MWYPKGAPISLVGYSYSDYVGWKVDKKSTSGAFHLLGSALVSHFKKQACVALSIVDVEYITANCCCA